MGTHLLTDAGFLILIEKDNFMFNQPPNPDQNPSSYVDLLKRMTQRVGEKKVDEKILEILQQAFDEGFKEENMSFHTPKGTAFSGKLQKPY